MSENAIVRWFVDYGLEAGAWGAQLLPGWYDLPHARLGQARAGQSMLDARAVLAPADWLGHDPETLIVFYKHEPEHSLASTDSSTRALYEFHVSQGTAIGPETGLLRLRTTQKLIYPEGTLEEDIADDVSGSVLPDAVRFGFEIDIVKLEVADVPWLVDQVARDDGGAVVYARSGEPFAAIERALKQRRGRVLSVLRSDLEAARPGLIFRDYADYVKALDAALWMQGEPKGLASKFMRAIDHHRDVLTSPNKPVRT